MRTKIITLSLLALVGLCACQKKEVVNREGRSNVGMSEEKKNELLLDQAQKHIDRAMNEGVEIDEAKEVDVLSLGGPERVSKDYILGTVGHVQLVRLFADQFSNLSQRQKIFTFHLVRAVCAGRNITFDQIHSRGLEVRKLVESVLSNSVGANLGVETGLSNYFQLLGVHSGFYDSFTGQKFTPEITYEDFVSAAYSAYASGAQLSLTQGESLEVKLAHLRRVMFDPGYESTIIPRFPPRGQDLLAGSHLNLYSGVNLGNVRTFKEHYPRNSRLVRIDNRLVEEVYRAGDKRRKIPPGRYASDIQGIIRWLHKAMLTAHKTERQILVNLIEYFSTGDPQAWENSYRAWRAQTLPIEFSLGFTDPTFDPRGIKSLYRGFVGYQDLPNTSKLESLLRDVQHFEKYMPWNKEYQRKWNVEPHAAAVHLIMSVGRGNGLLCKFSFRMPSESVRGEHYAHKILLFTNVIESHRVSIDAPLVQEFLPAGKYEHVLGYLAEFSLIQRALRELLGFDIGTQHPKAKQKLRDVLAPICYLKADLTALWLLNDPKLRELRMVSGAECVNAAADYTVCRALVTEALESAFPARPQVLAQRIFLRYVIEKARVVEIQHFDNKAYAMIQDHDGFKVAVGKLLANCGRILAQGDRRAALELIKRYGARATWPELNSIAERAQSVGLRRGVAFIMPRIDPERGTDKKVENASISYNETFEEQLLRYSSY